MIEIRSKRLKKLRGELPDVYVYDDIPNPLRVQIVHILRDELGDENSYYSSQSSTTRGSYRFIVESLCREYGMFRLVADKGERNYLDELFDFLLRERDIERVLDAVELSFRYLEALSTRNGKVSETASAVQELNHRFKEHGVGYEYKDEIIRVDSQFLHAEIVKPSLELLNTSKQYAGAQAEFLTAHEHYRHGRQKESMTESLKALESLMKAICTKRNWPFDPNATANALLQILFEHGLVPSFWTQHFAALRSTLEAGVPTGRNKLSGHGQGVEVRRVPSHIVAYVLHLTASAIVFLAAAESELTQG